jgi:hypothetical protein
MVCQLHSFATVAKLLNTVSCTLGLLLPLTFLNKPKSERQFPNYIIPIMGFLAFCFHANIAAGIFLDFDFFSNGNATRTTTPSACTVHGAIFQFTICATMIWMVCLTSTIYRMVCAQQTSVQIQSLEARFHFVAWVVPLLSTVRKTKQAFSLFSSHSYFWSGGPVGLPLNTRSPYAVRKRLASALVRAASNLTFAIDRRFLYWQVLVRGLELETVGVRPSTRIFRGLHPISFATCGVYTVQACAAFATRE